MAVADFPERKTSPVDVLIGIGVGAVFEMVAAAQTQKPWWVMAACWGILIGSIIGVVLLSNACSRGCRRHLPDDPERYQRCLTICRYLTAGLFLLALGISALLCTLVGELA
jgi:hypothetical protein